ncbi:MAG TPA: neuraminidase-like domain-containing protein, partial [Pyrinomonadaceae bacterium]
LSAYQALLRRIGTDYDEIRLARFADLPARSEFAARLALDVDPATFARPDRLDALLLDPTAVSPGPAITEEALETLFGLVGTTLQRDPLSDGLVLSDPKTQILRWSVNGLEWGRNTDADGFIYLSLTHPGLAYQIELFRDSGLTKLVASGVSASPKGVVTVAEQNHSGLSGTFRINYQSDAQDISLSAIPNLLAWRLDHLRPLWEAQDRPLDIFTDGASTIALGVLPAGIVFPPSIAGRLRYDAVGKVLLLDGVMSENEREDLLALAADADYQMAIQRLYLASRRSPLIDPDVIGPDDFRVPFVKTVPTDPDRPIDLWFRRRKWVDGKLAQFAAMTKVISGQTVPDFEAMLTAMYSPVVYEGTTVKVWDAATPSTGLNDLLENLQQGKKVDDARVKIEADLALSVDAFSRLMELRTKDVASQVDARNAPNSDGEWREVFSILVQAQKARLASVWRTEEDTGGVELGPRDFWPALREPWAGDWPPVKPADRPFIDPEIQKLKDLPEITIGERAINFWQARQTELAAARDSLWTTRETLGVDAMLRLALGDPNRGNPLAFNPDSLLTDLNSPLPSVRDAAVKNIEKSFHLSVENFRRVMDLRAKEADPDPLKRPTVADWTEVTQFLATADKEMHLYSNWIAAEQSAASGVVYWTALKARLPIWRAPAEARSAWTTALQQRSASPVIDPDLIGPGEIKVPFAGSRAFDLWNARQLWISGEITNLKTQISSAATTLDGFNAAFETAVGIKAVVLDQLDDALVNGDEIIGRLNQIGLDFETRDALTDVRKLAATGSVVLDSEWNDIAAILVQVEKVRRFATWRSEESKAGSGPGLLRGLVLGPDDFQLPERTDGLLPTVSLSLPRWRATYSARADWLEKLAGRIDQQNASIGEMRQAVDTAEGDTLIALRDALVMATDAPGSDLAGKAKWLTGRLAIDASMGSCQKVTRVAQALETLQTVVSAVRSGQLLGWSPGQIWLDAPDFDREWKWMCSYAPWRAAMLVCVFPERLLMPGLKKWRSGKFVTLVDNLRWTTSLTPRQACSEADAYAEYFHDVCTLTIRASCQTNSHAYREIEGACPIDAGQESLFYLFANSEHSGAAYWSVFNPDEPADAYPQTPWEPIPKLISGDWIAGAVPYNKSIYVFASRWEAGGPVIKYIRYSTELRAWIGDAIPLPLPKPNPKRFSFLVKQTEVENSPPHLLMLVDFELYEKKLNGAGTGWADTNWKQLYLDPWSDVGVAAKNYLEGSAQAQGFNGIQSLLGMVGLGGEPDAFFIFIEDRNGFIWCFYRRTVLSEKKAIHGTPESAYAWLKLDNGAYQGSFFRAGTFFVHLATSATPLWRITQIDEPGSIGYIEAVPVSSFIPNLQMVVPNCGFVLKAVQEKRRYFAYHLADGAFTGLLIRSGYGFVESKRSRAVPVSSGPFEIIQAGTASDQKKRATQIQATYLANSGASRSIFSHLEEAFRLVPEQVFLSLQFSGQYEAALSWARTVYDFTLPLADRKIDYGLVMEASLPAVIQRLDDWLLDPLDPHAIAASRRYAHTRFILLALVQCLYDYADSEFTVDTLETNAHARLLYSIALDLLDLPEFIQQGRPCEGLWIKLGEDIWVDERWGSLYSKLKARLTAVAEVHALEITIPKLKEVLSAHETWEKRFERATAIVTEAEAKARPTPTIGEIVKGQTEALGQAYRILLADSQIASSVEKVRRDAGDDFLNAVSALSGVSPVALQSDGVSINWGHSGTALQGSDGNQGGGQSIRSGAVTFSDAISRMKAQIYGHTIRAPSYWFCAPLNPALRWLRLHGELNLFKLRNCLNIAGMHRDLEPYSAPTDTVSGLPSITPGGQLIAPGAPGQRSGAGIRPTGYRSSVLLERAKQLAQLSAQIEDRRIPILEKRDAELYNLLKARQDVRLAQATVELQDLRVQEADAGVRLAQLQKDRAQFQADHWREMLQHPINEQERQSLDLMTAEANLHKAAWSTNVAAAAASAASLGTIVGSGSDSLAKSAAALSSMAAAYGAEASYYSSLASYERRSQDWQYQAGLAQEDIGIGQQSVVIAEAHLRVVGQERTIAQISADNASATVDFLSTKFMNAELYDWMSGVLERVHRFFLQQATATAKLYENQLAFERQEVPPAVIQADYWAPPSQGGRTTDRGGLTSSAR